MTATTSATSSKWLTDLLDKVKAAAPDASILIAAPLDRAEKDDNGNLRSMKTLLKIVELQEKIAKGRHIAFWNTFQAMGGKGSMAKWVQKGLAGSDLTHPSPQGATLIGDWFFAAIVTGYDAYASRNKDAPVLDAGLE